MGKCNYHSKRRSFAEREAGCPLNHCSRGHHVDIPDGEGSFAPLNCEECSAEGFCGNCGGKVHDGLSCEEYHDEHADEMELHDKVVAAERAAGWDPNP